MLKDVSWANGNAWAPCIEEKKIDAHYKYFFYFSANPVTNKGKQIGVATADSPLGPIHVANDPIILIQSPEEEIYGPAHCSVLQVPNKKDKWFIVYHRIHKEYLKHGPGWHREVCIDRMEFNEDGTIRQITPTP